MIDDEEFYKFMKDKNPIIVLDNCSILDLYRYSPDTSKSLLKVYQEEIENIWLPQQVFNEFNKRSQERYNAQFNQFNKIVTEVKLSTQKIESGLNKPFINAKKFFHPQVNHLENIVKEKLNELSSISEDYQGVIQNEIAESVEYFKQNNPQLLIDELSSNGKIGPGFTNFEKIRIFSEGDIRFRLKYPPGYMDEKDKDKNDETKTAKFGDLVLWKEILKKAKDDQRSILFITSDVKEDWWVLDKHGKVLNMHPLLIEEFVSETGLSKDNFLMLYTGKFFNLMIQQIHMNNMEEKLKMLQNMYSLNAEMKAKEIFYEQNKIESVEEELNLTAAFIHDGELQEFVPDPISDVEVIDISEFEITDSVFYKDSENFVIESLVSALCDVKVDVPSIVDMDVAYGYDVMIKFNIEIIIPIKPIEEVIGEDTQPIIRELNEEKLLDIENINFNFSDLNIITCIETSSPFDDGENYSNDICTECKKKHASYFKYDGERICDSCSKYWDACPDCGFFYPSGSFIGPFCERCEEESS